MASGEQIFSTKQADGTTVQTTLTKPSTSGPTINVAPNRTLDPTEVSFSQATVSGSLNPKSVRFTQNNIGAKFKDGSSVNDLVTGLKNGSVNPNSLPPIRTFDVNGQLYSLDNRRLYAYQQAGVKIPTKPARASEIAKDSEFKFSTTNGGQDIAVRGQ